MEGERRERVKPQQQSTEYKDIISKDVFDFQVRFAVELQKKIGEPFERVLFHYTGLGYRMVSLDELDSVRVGLTPENASDKLYAAYRRKISAPRPQIDPALLAEMRHQSEDFGCFSYVDGIGPYVEIHFQNKEGGKNGPLSTENIPARQADLTAMLRDIKTRFPEAKEIHGFSWLYNIDAYKRLFPASYIASARPPDVTFEDSYYIWRGILDQFRDSEGNLKQELVEPFLAKIRTTPVEKLLTAIPYMPLEVRGPIEDFYELYGIE